MRRSGHNNMANCLRQQRGDQGCAARQGDILAGVDEESVGGPGHRLDPGGCRVPVQYPGAVKDPDTGVLISDAEVAEVAYTAFADNPQEVTARLVVRRVRDRNIGPEDEMFPVWRYHPFFTNSTEPVADADITHRRHAIIETLFADLIDGPLAHLPSGSFWANSAWTVLAAIAHNLLRAAGTLAGTALAVARGATLRRHLVNVPARFTRPQGRPRLHLPTHWPRATAWNKLWDNVFDCDATDQVAA